MTQYVPAGSRPRLACVSVPGGNRIDNRNTGMRGRTCSRLAGVDPDLVRWVRGVDAAARHIYNAIMVDRSGDWLTQAERNLDQARGSAASDRHEWACFAAQQAGEMAVKALHLRMGQEAWGHVVRRLLEELPSEVGVPAELLDAARVLDAYYVATRYPNGHPAGAPGEHYGALQSSEAIRYASQIFEFCRVQMAAP